MREKLARLLENDMPDPAGHYAVLLRLLRDDAPSVRQIALVALGYTDWTLLWRDLLDAIGEAETRSRAAALLTACGPAAVPAIEARFESDDQPAQLRLIRVLGRVGGDRALALLVRLLAQTEANEALRSALLQALSRHCYRAGPAQAPALARQLALETDYAAGLRAALSDLGAVPPPLRPALGFLHRTLASQLSRARQRLAGYRLLLAESSPPARRERAGPMPRLDWRERLIVLLAPARLRVDPWLWICTAYTAVRLALTDPRVNAALVAARQTATATCYDRLVQETLNWAARQRLALTPPAGGSHHGYQTMLTTLERVVLLKDARLFRETPDVVLLELASLLEEVDAAAGATLFAKGDAADGMYIIVTGRVMVRDGERVLNRQSRGETFGELALLDDQPRLATVTAIEDTRLLKLDRAGFYLLLEDHIEFARGVIRVLSGYLRDNLRRREAIDD